VDDPIEQGVGGAVPEGRDPGGVAQHRAQREDVGGGGDLARPRDLLGRHETRRPDHRSGAGERGALQRPGDAEVDDARSVVGQQDVGGLEVAVHQPRPVDGLQRLGQPGGQDAQRVLRQRPLLGEHRRQRRPRDVGGDQPGRVAVGVGVDDGSGVEAADPPGRLDLGGEPLPELRIGRQLRPHHLDRHRPAAGGAPQVDLAHAAAAEPGLEPVPADDPGVGFRQGLHRPPHLRMRERSGSRSFYTRGTAADSAPAEGGQGRPRAR